MTRKASTSQAEEASETTESVTVLPLLERAPASATWVRGLTSVELSGELGKSPKTIRQALRDKYGKLPFESVRWGALASEQEDYLRVRFR